MKVTSFSIILGFIVGLILSGILVDIYSYVKGSVDRIIIARNISKAERYVKEGQYQQAIEIYEKVYAKIKPKKEQNESLFGKVANNLGLSLVENSGGIKSGNKNLMNSKQVKKALEMFKEAKASFLKIKNNQLADQTEQNIKMLEQSL
ncbi:hypothetical protein [Candidatus Ruminimicrobium bovinum]|uniref:hypothetical protein n=1 Tax=Candidatus Ruminimicrobium bovinum TaxID=3242779 RepID=UPI0039B90142